MLEKIAVIGAGPAGCAFCSEIDTDRYEVYLIDRKPSQRTEGREGILAERAINFIKKRSIPEQIFSYPKEINISYIDLQTGTRNLQDTAFLNINRPKFDSWLVDQVKERVHYCSETEFLGYEQGSTMRIRVKSQGEERELEVDYLIGADGPLSKVRASFISPVKTYKAVQRRVRAKPIPRNAYFFYHLDIIDCISWGIPKGDHLIIGFALDGQLDKPQIEERLDFLNQGISNHLNLHIEDCFESCQYFLSNPQSREDFVFGLNDRIILIGEAAGLISASSGEGIGPALYSGQQAARALNEKGGLGLYREYCSDLVVELAKKIKKHQEINKNLKSLFTQRSFEERG